MREIYPKSIHRLLFFVAIFSLVGMWFAGWNGIQTTVYATTETIADDFDDGSNSTGWGGNDGTQHWLGNWNNNGDVWVQKMSGWCVSGYCLRLIADSDNPQTTSERRADLSTVSSATLRFDYTAYIGTSAGRTYVELSNDGATYSILDTLPARATAATQSYTIPAAYLTADFRLRFRAVGTSPWTDFYVDNIVITLDDNNSPTATPIPPTATPKPTGSTLSAGCGIAANSDTGYRTLISSGVTRQYYLSVPDTYDPNKGYNLVFGYHGLNYNGRDMRTYLRLETTSSADNTIFVYPNGLHRHWPEFGSNYSAIGWLTGQTSANEDFIFFDDMLETLAQSYCIDLARVYVTGQSWGGDMASSLSCARGDQIAATTAVGINGDFFFTGHPTHPNKYPAITPTDCRRPVPMITYRGAGDVYKGGRSSDWWYQVNQCQQPAGHATKESITVNGRYEDNGCLAPTIYIRYENPPSYMGGDDHQIPATFETETMDFFLQHRLSSGDGENTRFLIFLPFTSRHTAPD